jgi:hypothetical protein
VRSTVEIFVNEPKRDRAVREALAAAGVTSAESADGFWRISLDGESPELPRVLQELREAGIEYFHRREHVYTDDELASFPLLSLFVTSEERGLGGPSYGTTFDLGEACPACGTGARQTSPLLLDAADTPRRGDLFQTLDGEILVSPRVAEALDGANLGAVSLKQARDHRTGAPIPWHQLLVVHELPPWHPDSVGFEREEPCPECRRDGYFHGVGYPFELVYAATELDEAPDVAWTYERFGNSKLREDVSESHFAAPQLLVSPHFREVLVQAGVGEVDFLPVRAARL